MAEEVFEKEVKWGTDRNDFVGEKEITVTITLHEYRELVEKNAKRGEEVRKLEEKWGEEARKARALREKLDKLLEAVGGEEPDTEDEE